MWLISVYTLEFSVIYCIYKTPHPFTLAFQGEDSGFKPRWPLWIFQNSFVKLYLKFTTSFAVQEKIMKKPAHPEKQLNGASEVLNLD